MMSSKMTGHWKVRLQLLPKAGLLIAEALGIELSNLKETRIVLASMNRLASADD